MTTASFRRSAAYFNNLVKISNMKAGLSNRVREEIYKERIELLRRADLEIVYKYIERSANQGAVRVFNWEWSTPAPIRKLLFEDKEIQTYMQNNGFTYSDNPECVEWWAAEEPKAPLQLK